MVVSCVVYAKWFIVAAASAKPPTGNVLLDAAFINLSPAPIVSEPDVTTTFSRPLGVSARESDSSPEISAGRCTARSWSDRQRAQRSARPAAGTVAQDPI